MKLVALAGVAVVLALTSTSSAAAATPVNNAVVTVDTAGERLDAHDGTIVPDDFAAPRSYWQVGTSYGCGFRWNVPGTTWCGIRVYRSTDLSRWTPAGAVGGKYAFDATTPAWQSRCGGTLAVGCFRPHIAKRPDGTWVMWVNAPATAAGYVVLTAPAPGGPYTEVATPPRLAVGNGTTITYGDFDITPDPADPAVAWIVYTVIDSTLPRTSGGAVVHDLVAEKLDPTWTTGSGRKRRFGLSLAEAPGLWRRGAYWYLTFADPACPYCSGTGTAYSRVSWTAGPLGGWSGRRRISANSCSGQTADVDHFWSPSHQAVSVWAVDRWVRNAAGTSFDPNQARANNYLAPLTYNPDGTIPVQPCRAAWTFS